MQQGAAFDDDLVYAVGDVISTEMRAFGNTGRAGLTAFTPNITPFKDPRWGRGKETPGEDPFHVSSYTRAIVSGFEGNKSRQKKVITTCKHFGAYDVEKWGNVTRYTFDALVTMQDLAEYYNPSFEVCARDAGTGSVCLRIMAPRDRTKVCNFHVMSSYNALNGVPTSVNSYLINDLLREHWGWEQSDHFVVSDCAAIDVAFNSHNWTKTPEETAADAVKAGLDNDRGYFLTQYLPSAVEQGLIDVATVKKALARVYGGLMTLGYFDPPAEQPYRSIDWSAVNTLEHQNLARRAASAGITLLKNTNDLLPLSLPVYTKNLTIALLGEWTNATKEMQSEYSGIAPFLHSPLYALQQLPGVVIDFVDGLNNSSPALEAASKTESLDRYSIAWNSTQTWLINSLASVGNPMVLVQMGGGQLDDSEFLANSNISSILWAGYPGQDGGPAIVDVLFGKVAPAGRLPVTQYPAKYVDEIVMTDMSLRPHDGGPGRTYMWYQDEPVVPFGYGLHYTSFSAKAWIVAPGHLHSNGSSPVSNTSQSRNTVCSEITQPTFDISALNTSCSTDLPLDRCVLANLIVAIENSGNTTSDYSTLAFVKGEYGPAPHPNKKLVGYKRLHDIKAGETQLANIPITIGALNRWDEGARRILYPGNYSIAIDAKPELYTLEFDIIGEALVLETYPGMNATVHE
ncbi:putative glycoside hydrolase, family 3, glycoside hydrolase family 3 domain, immunoglobulin [Septoria linicola]|nr:putative glycoside hydrolase, family 3, glycoside hydrolase family 3 domain, immunoglobulin [Septoria linicola]